MRVENCKILSSKDLGQKGALNLLLAWLEGSSMKHVSAMLQTGYFGALYGKIAVSCRVFSA
jgi:hypothetical protein